MASTSGIAELADIARQMDERKTALREELSRIEEAERALGVGTNGGTQEKPAPRRRSTKAAQPSSRIGRRAQVILSVLAEKPGLTIPQIAEEVGLSQPNYLYRALPKLEQAGRVRQDDEKRWYPASE